MRLFFAVPIPAEVSREITVEQRKIISSALRWVAPENQHFTLRFLGEVPEEEGRVGGLISAGQETALKHHSFLLTISGAGFFPDEERPRVFWVGVGDGSEKLIVLAGDLSSVLDAVGQASRLSEDRFFSENCSFLPHLTVARVNAGEGFSSIPYQKLESWKTRNFGSFPVNEFCLMESLLLPTGVVYRKVHSFLLAPSP